MAAEEEWDGVGGLYGEFILFSEWLTGVKRVKMDGNPDTWYGVFGLYMCIGEVESDLIECYRSC